eukprot:8834886-Alexandrium_andersonii.AAC.1
MQNCFRRSELELRGPMNVLSCPPCKASSGWFGIAWRAEPDGDDETCWRARRRCFSGGSGGRSPPWEGHSHENGASRAPRNK